MIVPASVTKQLPCQKCCIAAILRQGLVLLSKNACADALIPSPMPFPAVLTPSIVCANVQSLCGAFLAAQLTRARPAVRVISTKQSFNAVTMTTVRLPPAKFHCKSLWKCPGRHPASCRCRAEASRRISKVSRACARARRRPRTRAIPWRDRTGRYRMFFLPA